LSLTVNRKRSDVRNDINYVLESNGENINNFSFHPKSNYTDVKDLLKKQQRKKKNNEATDDIQ
jgi:hypothetical protein